MPVFRLHDPAAEREQARVFARVQAIVAADVDTYGYPADRIGFVNHWTRVRAAFDKGVAP